MAYENMDSEAGEQKELVSTALEVARQKADLDQQITTAKTYPRSYKRFTDRCMSLATVNADVAAGMLYSLPRGGKPIEGPSARLAEVIQHAWGNTQTGQRVIEEGDEFVVAEGIFYDLENNNRITVHVKRRITDKEGRRYNTDMIGVTGNAASSIAHRNAVLKGVPKSFWQPIYLAARRAAVGDIKTLAATRAEAIAFVTKTGVSEAQIFAALGVQGIEDIDIEKLATLRAVVAAVKSKEMTIDEAFPPIDTRRPEAKGKPETKEPQKKGAAKTANKAAKPDAKPADTKQLAKKPLTTDQRTVIKDKLKEEGVAETLLYAQLEVNSLDQIEADQYKAVLAKIDELSSAGT